MANNPFFWNLTDCNRQLLLIKIHLGISNISAKVHHLLKLGAFNKGIYLFVHLFIYSFIHLFLSRFKTLLILPERSCSQILYASTALKNFRNVCEKYVLQRPFSVTLPKRDIFKALSQRFCKFLGISVFRISFGQLLQTHQPETHTDYCIIS